MKTAYGKRIQDIKHQTKERFEWIERNIQVDPIKQKNSCGSYARRKQRGSLFERKGKDFDRFMICRTRSSKKERRVDALALRAEERRDKLRKATGRSKYPEIRGCLNGETHWRRPPVSIRQSITYGREPGELKHLSSRRKRKKTRYPK